jgi:hypothetical protein
MMFNDV